MDITQFRDRFGDVPQKGDLTLLCPLLDDPTEKVSAQAGTAGGPHSRRAPVQAAAGSEQPLLATLQRWWWQQACHCTGVTPVADIRYQRKLIALTLVAVLQIFVFFPDAAKVGVKDIKVGTTSRSTCHTPGRCGSTCRGKFKWCGSNRPGKAARASVCIGCVEPQNSAHSRQPEVCVASAKWASARHALLW